MKTLRSATALAIAALVLPAPGLAHRESDLAATLEQVLVNHLKAYDAEDASGTLRDLHTKSPEYKRTAQEIAQQFAAQDLSAELVTFRFLGHDDEFAVARTKVKFAGPPGSSFADNILDSITVFHQENGTWKLWSDEALGVEFIPD
jgi:hypothetical protein